MKYKKISICILIFFSISIIFGCTNKDKTNDVDSKNSTVNLDKNINKELKNIEKATSLLNIYLNNEDGYMYEKGLGNVLYEYLSDRYIIASIIGKRECLPSRQEQGWPILIDLKEDKCKFINLESINYIDYVTFKDNKINFYLKPEQRATGYKSFPSVIEYDIEKDKQEKKKLFKSIEDYSVVLGNGVNEMELKSIEENENKLLFKFQANENTMFIGSYLVPKIKIGPIHNSDIFYIDFENVILDKSNEKIIEKLKEEDYIIDAFSKTFEDEINNKHLVIYFKFNNMDEYNCEFVNENKGYCDFQITYERK